MKHPMKRLLSGFGLLAAIAALSLMATTSVFAFHNGYTQSSASNAGPLNNFGAVVPSSITPGSSTTYTANYTFTVASSPAGSMFSFTSAGAGNSTTGFNTVSPQNTTIGTMYQQWRHSTLTDRWFYLYAGNRNSQGTAAEQNNASTANASFAYYFYTRERGQTTFNSSGSSTVNVGLGTFASAQTGTSGIIYIDAAGTYPIATVIGMTASVSPAISPAGAGTRSTASFAGNVRWGIAQEAWPSGSATLLQAVESVPLETTSNPTAGSIANPSSSTTATTFADPWNQPVTLTLGDTAPAQSATGVTNLGTVASPGARNVNTSYTIQQVVTDTNGDINNAKLIFVFTSGDQVGQWFQVGFVNGDNNDNTISFLAGNCEYMSAFEARRTSTSTGGTSCSSITTNYLTSFTASAATTSGANTSETVSYNLTFNTTARGTVSVFGRGEDYHGLTSGNVLVGALTIS